MPKLIDIHARTIRRPMRMAFTTALGSKREAVSVLVRADLAGGASGLGEVPTSFVLPDETAPAIRRTLREAADLLRGRDVKDALSDLSTLRQRVPARAMTFSGLEVALLRAELHSRGVSEWTHWGGKLKTIRSDITIFFTPDPQPLQQWIDQAVDGGFDTFKVKTSGKVDADVAFLRSVRERLARRLERFTLRLDGNQGYTARSLERMFARLDRAGIDYELFEQPLAKDDYAGMKRIARSAPRPILLDETVFVRADLQRAIDEGLGHGVNVKLAKSGPREAEALLALARRAGLRTMIGCMSETMVGLSAGILLAAGAGGVDYVDLDSIHFFPHRRRYGPIEIAAAEYRIHD